MMKRLTRTWPRPRSFAAALSAAVSTAAVGAALGASVSPFGCASLDDGGASGKNSASKLGGAEAAMPPAPPARPDTPLILVVMPPAKPFQEVRRSLSVEIKRAFNVETFVVGPGVGAPAFKATIERAKPK